MSKNQAKSRKLGFVTCVSDAQVLRRRLLASECLNSGAYEHALYFNAPSAAAAFSAAQEQMLACEWLVWVHQDVFLPPGWDTQFIGGLELAAAEFPRLAVAGVYGVAGSGPSAVRAGHVLDRGTLLQETAALPCAVRSLDELLFAVRLASGMRLDPALGFDFYATDIALAAIERGMEVAVVDAYCEHWSDTSKGRVTTEFADRVVGSGNVFESKWAHRLPIETPCFSINRPGDLETFARRLVDSGS
ncbi:MAG: hypothetical protein NT159_24350 [Proteobacteria bacterium]|nr:hypothetical protein [Pseudomonadota bacterium]